MDTEKNQERLRRLAAVVGGRLQGRLRIKPSMGRWWLCCGDSEVPLCGTRGKRTEGEALEAAEAWYKEDLEKCRN